MAQKTLLLLLLALTLAACKKTPPPSHSEDQGRAIPLRYATLLRLVEHKTYVEATVKNPWDTLRVLARYEIRTPLRRAAVFTSVHCALLSELGALSRVAGAADTKYIYCPAARRRIQAGTIKDFGDAMTPSVEALVATRPDGLLVSPFENSTYDRLSTIAPLYYAADYMEPSPLARAEWVKFYGILFGCRERADSLFRSVETHYLRLRRHAARRTPRPTVLCEMPQGGQWYIAGGESTASRLIADAGASYLFSDVKGGGARAMALEHVFERAHDADFWFIKYAQAEPLTLSQLKADNPLFAEIRAFRTGRVYACNTLRSDYYEATPFHPDRDLEALTDILYHGGRKATYYIKVK